MTRRLLLVTSEPQGEPVGPLPVDPTLTAERQVTQMTGIGQNTVSITEGGCTYRTEHRVSTDCNGVVLAYGAFVQGTASNPWTAKVTLELADGTLIPVTFDNGQDHLTCANGGSTESDHIDIVLGEGERYHLRTFIPGGITVPTGRNVLYCRAWNGEHLTEEWVDSGGEPESPLPIATIGKTRPTIPCPAMIGDSIAAQGAGADGWWRKVVGLNPGLSYGRNANKFINLDGREGDTLRAATHVVVQYGANDLGGAPAVANVWQDAVACYAYVNALNPGVPIYQTTCTPIVATTDGCVTLANQTPFGGRLPWNAFLRDGAPCHPDTKAALAVGATGTVIRVGQEGHPLAGVLDVAAEVEEGGTIAPTGKWACPGGVSWGGDGVHPTVEGQDQMKIPLDAWYATLTA